MKKIIYKSIPFLVLMVLFSCAGLKKSAAGYDEVYDDPIELRKQQLAAQKKQEEEKERQRKEWYAQKENELNSDSRYSDREFSAEDYYDYEYASRLKRFHSNNPGLSYYDDWYTNQWYYNPYPCSWSNSIYAPGFNSCCCNSWNAGWNTPGVWGLYSPGFGWNYGFSYGIGWGYQPYWNSPFYNSWYWNNPWYWNNWGWGSYYGNPYWNYLYYNPYDVNTYHYGPRGNAGGSNSPIRSYAGMPLGEAEKNLEGGRMGFSQNNEPQKFQSFQEYFTLKDHPDVMINPKSTGPVRDFTSDNMPSANQNLNSKGGLNADPVNNVVVPRNGIRSKIYATEYASENINLNQPGGGRNLNQGQTFNIESGQGNPVRSGNNSAPLKGRNLSGGEDAAPVRLEKSGGGIRGGSPSNINISVPRGSGGGVNIRPR